MEDDRDDTVRFLDVVPTVHDGPAPRAPRPPLWTGQIFAHRYRILDTIGEGGMGIVYLAFDERLRRRVALKLLRMLGYRTPGAAERLIREARAVALISHPNVASVFDVGFVDGHVFIVMEYVAGTSLRRWLEERTRRLDDVLDVFVRISAGVDAAHEAGILHRDIKPDNVLVTTATDVHVVDFGLARSMAEQPDSDRPEPSSDEVEPSEDEPAPFRTARGIMVGTPAYMAPELAQGHPPSVRSDVYSVCATLYEALFGRRPRDCTGTAASIRTAAARPLDWSGRSLPRRLRSLLQQGLSVSPGDRPASMAKLLAVLRRVRARRSSRRWASVALLACLGGGMTSYFASSDRSLATCRAEGDAVDEVWNPQTRQRVRKALLASDISFAPEMSRHADEGLERFAEAWRSTRQLMCLAEDDGEPELRARHEACLQYQLFALDGVVTAVGGVDPQSLAQSVDAVSSLPDPASCLDPFYLRTLPPDPSRPEAGDTMRQVRARIAKAAAARSAGRLADAWRWLFEAERMSKAVAEPTLEAELALERGRLQADSSRYTKAEASVRKAIALAEQTEYRRLRARGLVELADIVGRRQKRFDTAEEILRLAEPVVHALASPSLERDWAITRGEVLLAMERFDDAAAHFESLLDTVVSDTQRADILHMLGEARMRDHADLAIEVLHEALALRSKHLGESHPRVADTVLLLARIDAYRGHDDSAAKRLDRVTDIRQRVFGPRSLAIAEVERARGTLALRRGKLAEARVHLQRSGSIVDEDEDAAPFDTAALWSALGVVESRAGNYSRAEALQRNAADLLVRHAGPNHPRLALPYLNLSSNDERQRRWEAAVGWLERALEVADTVPQRTQMRAALGQLRIRAGDLGGAQHEFSLVIDRGWISGSSWRSAQRGLAEIELRRGDVKRAAELVLPMLEELESNTPKAVERAEFVFTAARVLWARNAPGDRAQARAMIENALAEVQSMGSGFEILRDDLSSWLARTR